MLTRKGNIFLRYLTPVRYLNTRSASVIQTKCDTNSEKFGVSIIPTYQLTRAEALVSVTSSHFKILEKLRSYGTTNNNTETENEQSFTRRW